MKVFILYPEGEFPLERIDDLHGLKMFLCDRGNLDDAQHTVKEIFSDLNFREQVGLSAVNSINLASVNRVLFICMA